MSAMRTEDSDPDPVGRDQDGRLAQTKLSLAGSAPTTGGPADLGELYDAYLDQISHADRLLGRILDRLRSEGLLDTSIVVVTADHGVRRGIGRGTTPNDVDDWVTRVPLIISAPSLEPSVTDRPTQLQELSSVLVQLMSSDVGGIDTWPPRSGIESCRMVCRSRPLAVPPWNRRKLGARGGTRT